jgi:ribosomal protein L35
MKQKKMGIKAIKKRFAVTKTGKIMRRPSHLGHNQAKLPDKTKHRLKKRVGLYKTHSKYLKKYL